MTSVRRIGGYEIEHLLGEGSGGAVWRARQLAAFDRPVALKRIAVRDDAVRAARIRDEARALAALDHPHIIRILEVVEDGDLDTIAIAMQLAAGGSLAERLSRRESLPADVAIRLAIDVASALASAHRRRILHLDVKPANVLFTSDGEVLVADFGAAGGAAGTPGFAAPEVVSGDAVDERADVFGVGALVQAMVGKDVPSELASVAARATAVAPVDRYASMRELIDALEGVDLATSAVRVPPLPAAGAGNTVEFGPRPPARAAEQPGRKRRVPRVALVGVLLVLGAISAIYGGNRAQNRVVKGSNVVVHDGARYELGVKGDVAVVGDWDCKGIVTPAVWRPSTREVFFFKGWATTGAPRPASTRTHADQPPTPPSCARA